MTRLKAFWKYIDYEVLGRVPMHNVFVALLLVSSLSLYGFCSLPDGHTAGPGITEELVVAGVPPAVFARTLEAYGSKEIGLLDRLRGIESRQPHTIVTTDTVFAPPETCTLGVVIRDGNLSVPVLTQAEGGYRAEILEDVPVADCDDIEVSPDGTLRCDTPRLGHWSLLFGANVSSPLGSLQTTPGSDVGLGGYAGVHWQGNRSSSLSLAILMAIDQRVEIRAEKKVRIW